MVKKLNWAAFKGKICKPIFRVPLSSVIQQYTIYNIRLMTKTGFKPWYIELDFNLMALLQSCKN